ncbi:hypothetical protein GCM10023195_27820 [Actinoallomurus liliacearum]|uniref:Uncharacterized protein n=1 Tax=Actinoallomurus liliacearum TaxID=1080073 RepID=A0ABP8TLE5_9ACTN
MAVTSAQADATRPVTSVAAVAARSRAVRERSTAAPGLELLLPLTKAYRVPLDELVGAPVAGATRVYPQPFTHNGMTVVPLTR